MKKLLTTLTLGLTLATGVFEAHAATLLTDWTYTLNSVTLTNFNTHFVDVNNDPATSKENASFQSGGYGITLTPSDTTTTDSLIFPGDNSSASSVNNDKLLSQTTVDLNSTNETPSTKIADIVFSYSTNSISNPGVYMDITYTIPLYTFYSDDAKTAYVYYNNSEVSTTGATAITHDGYKYGVTGVGLFVDGRALVSFPGGENDPNLYSGWAINTDTMGNHYDQYVVGGDANVSTGVKAGDFYGSYSITGVFSIANSYDEPKPTPEPATMLLTGLGLAGLGAIKRRRNRIQ